MTNQEAKQALEVVGGFLIFIRATCMPKDDEHMTKVVDDYMVASEIAKEAIDLMDREINIEKEGDK